MPAFFRAANRWKKALFLSLAFHLVLVLAILFCPKPQDQPISSSSKTRPSLRLERSRPQPTKPTGEENAEEGEGFQAAIHSEMLIEAPKLVVSKTVPSAMIHSAPSGPQLAPGPLPGKGGGVGSAGKGTTFFKVGTTARRIMYVLDASSSMGRDGLWERASRELVKSLDQLPADVAFQIIVYHSKPRTLLTAPPGWLTWDGLTPAKVLQALNNLMPEGRTEHAPALSKALSMRPDVLFFLTDADDLTYPLLAQVDGWNRGKTVIHTFELNRRAGQRPGGPLHLLATRNGGEYRLVGEE